MAEPNMKVIVIAGGGRKAGKTTLAAALADLLPDAQKVKLGEHPPKTGKPPLPFPLNASYKHVVETVGTPAFLIIESGKILDDPDLTSDLAIFLPARGHPDKPGSDRRRAQCDLIRGEPIDEKSFDTLQRKLGVPKDTFHALLEAAEVPLA